MCKRIDDNGIKFMLSNSSSKLSYELYSDFCVETVRAPRSISRRADGRNSVDEIVVRNY